MSNFYHRPPKEAPGISRQINSIVTKNNDFISLATTELSGKEKLSLFHCDKAGNTVQKDLIVEDETHPHIGKIVLSKTGKIFVVCNVFCNNQWQIVLKTFNDKDLADTTTEVIYQTENVILPPAIALHNSNIHIVWAEEKDGFHGIYHITGSDTKASWSTPQLLSEKNINSQRPCIATLKDSCFVCWDRMIEDRHEVQYLFFNERKKSKIVTLGHKNERWFLPQCVSDQEQELYLAWIVTSLVRDDNKDIYEHQTGGMCAKVTIDEITIIEDQNNALDSRFSADMREGLLGVKRPENHFGSRRRLQPCLWNGQLWLCWELGRFYDMIHTTGFLVGRKLEGGSWTKVYQLFEGMVSYSLPPFICNSEDQIPVSFVNITNDITTEKNIGIPHFDTIALEDIQEFQQRDPEEWNHWKKTSSLPQKHIYKPLKVKEKDMQVFWADTHCHSYVSADAEGELDEIVSIARDTAKLDIIAIVDNDYYPFKGVFESEWKILQELAKHYSESGKFLFFPAYEYTYHREGGVTGTGSNFNHRYIMYPHSGGPLIRRVDPKGVSDKELMQNLKGTKALPVTHHTTWELIDPKIDHTVEVCSAWRNCIEESDFIIKQLKKGIKFGFVGSSDTHRILPGMSGALTGVIAEELTDQAIFDAYRKRRLIATSGCRMSLDFRVDRYFIGEEGEGSQNPIVQGKVNAPRRIEIVQIIRDGEVINEITPADASTEFEFTDKNINPGEHFYFMRVKVEGDPSYNIGIENREDYRTFDSNLSLKYPHNFSRADGNFGWTSPIWLTVK